MDVVPIPKLYIHLHASEMPRWAGWEGPSSQVPSTKYLWYQVQVPVPSASSYVLQKLGMLGVRAAYCFRCAVLGAELPSSMASLSWEKPRW